MIHSEMRTIYLSLIIFCSLGHFAQNVFSYHSFRESVYGAVSIGNAVYYVERSADNCCHEAIIWSKARNGQFVTRINITGWPLTVATSDPPLIDVTADNCLAVVSYTNYGVCDHFFDPQPVIFKIDISGFPKWKVPFRKGRIGHILGLMDSSIVFVVHKSLFRMNSMGVITDSITSGLGIIHSLCRYNA